MTIINVAAICQYGTDSILIKYWLGCTLLFFEGTYASYIQGGLHLPKINFVSEGIPALSLTFIILSFTGSEIAKKVCDVLAFPAVVVICIVALVQIYWDFKSCHDYGKRKSEIWKGLIPHGMLICLTLIWDYIEPEVYKSHPRLFLTLIGLIFFRFNYYLMVHLIVNRRLKIFQSVLIPFPIIFLNILQRKGYIHFLPWNTSFDFDLYLFFSYVLLFVMINGYNIIIDMTETLNIKVFRIPYEKND